MAWRKISRRIKKRVPKNPKRFSIETIQKRIETINLEIIDLEEKIKPLLEQVSLHEQRCAIFYPEINSLKSEIFALEKKKSIIRYLITGSYFSSEVIAKRNALAEDLSLIQDKIPADATCELSRLKGRLNECKKSLAEHENALTLKKEQLERKLKEKFRQEEIQRKKMEELRAAAASLTEETRRLGAQIRTRLETQTSCPYCGDILGKSHHADHIYPVSKGGRSVESNMVLVCVSCNTKKSDLTLSSFIVKFGLERGAIEARLTAMGKEF